MVLQERIELSTSPLPRECSTTELLQRWVFGACGQGRADTGLVPQPGASRKRAEDALDPIFIGRFATRPPLR
jgi:hypothetical protein